MVKTQLFKPHPALQDFVRYILVIDALVDPGSENLICHYPPTPHQCIVLYLSGPLKAKKIDDDEFTEKPTCVVVGPQVTRVNLMINKHHKAVNIGFQPGGLHRLLGMPLHELYDDGFDGHYLLGPEVERLIESCSLLSDLFAIKNEVDEFLLNKLRNLKDVVPFDLAMHQLIRQNGNVVISDVASLACLSLRQFERKCYERLGMSPKIYARIARFSHAYNIFERSHTIDWASIAYQSGYFDQMHFIRDFKQFAGVTPTLMENEIASAPFKFQAAYRF
jgi:AraC-like DNA-binding protein